MLRLRKEFVGWLVTGLFFFFWETFTLFHRETKDFLTRTISD